MGVCNRFFIDNHGTILTNKHVIYHSTTTSNYNTILVRTANLDEWIYAEVVKVGEIDDLAEIKIDRQNTKYFNLKENISNGESIYTIGNPNGFGLSFTNGIVSINERNIIYNEKNIKTFQTSLVINEGNSGGPIFNKYGQLLGIVSFRLKDKSGDVIQGVSFALPSSTIISFLQD